MRCAPTGLLNRRKRRRIVEDSHLDNFITDPNDPSAVMYEIFAKHDFRLSGMIRECPVTCQRRLRLPR